MPYLNPFSSLEDKLDQVLANQARILENLNKEEKEVKMAQVDLTQLKADVAANTSAVQSAETLMSGLSAQIATLIANSNGSTVNVADLQALQVALEANNTGLAAAVVANTPTQTNSQNPAS